MRTFVYGDPHFHHAKIIEYAERPFKDVEEMNQTIIKNHNEVITARDKVFILGDFALASRGNTEAIIRQLRGYKILVMGNHDHHRSVKAWMGMGFNEVYRYPIIVDMEYILSHEPVLPLGDFTNIHGHTHQHSIMNKHTHVNVSLDVTEFKPVLFDSNIDCSPIS